jgi:hypothetical protein
MPFFFLLLRETKTKATSIAMAAIATITAHSHQLKPERVVEDCLIVIVALPPTVFPSREAFTNSVTVPVLEPAEKVAPDPATEISLPSEFVRDHV